MSNQQIGADNWLHILSHGLCNYVDEGGTLTVTQTAAGVVVTFTGVMGEDDRLHKKFRKLLAAQTAVAAKAQAVHHA